MSSGKFIDLYKTLAVSPSATGAQIRAAFYKLAKTCHPDVTSTGSSEKFKCVNEAYQTLSTKRREYDLEYAAHFGKVPGAAEIEVRFKKASKAHPAYSETHMSDADSMREAFSHGWARSAWGPRSTFRSFKGGYGKHPGSFCWNDDNDLHDDNHGTSQFFDKHYEKTETDNDVDYAESRTRSGKANRSNWSSRNRTVNTWVDFDPDWIFDETAAPYDDVHHVRMSRRDGRYVLHGPGTNRLSKLKVSRLKLLFSAHPQKGVSTDTRTRTCQTTVIAERFCSFKNPNKVARTHRPTDRVNRQYEITRHRIATARLTQSAINSCHNRRTKKNITQEICVTIRTPKHAALPTIIMNPLATKQRRQRPRLRRYLKRNRRRAHLVPIITLQRTTTTTTLKVQVLQILRAMPQKTTTWTIRTWRTLMWRMMTRRTTMTLFTIFNPILSNGTRKNIEPVAILRSNDANRITKAASANLIQSKSKR